MSTIVTLHPDDIVLCTAETAGMLPGTGALAPDTQADVLTAAMQHGGYRVLIAEAGDIARHAQLAQTFRRRLVALGRVPGAELASLHIEGADAVVVGPDARAVTQPLAVVADLHGCAETAIPALDTLLLSGRIPVLVGDFTDKGGVRATGPEGTGNPEDSGAVRVLRWLLEHLGNGEALAVLGNRDVRLRSALQLAVNDPADTCDAVMAVANGEGGFKAGPALRQTLLDLAVQEDADELVPRVVALLNGLPTHLVFPGVVVSHGTMTRRHLFKDERGSRSVLWNEDAMWDEPAEHSNGALGRVHIHGHVTEPAGPLVRRVAHPEGPRAASIGIDTGCYLGSGLTVWLPDAGQHITVPTDPKDVWAQVDHVQDDAHEAAQALAA